MRRKIRGVSEEELAAKPLFTSRPQSAPPQEPPPPPPASAPPPPAPAPRTPAPVVHPEQPAAASSPPADPTPPPPQVDPTAVADRIVEHLIERLRAPKSVEPSDAPAPAPATLCHHHRTTPQCRSLRTKRRSRHCQLEQSDGDFAGSPPRFTRSRVMYEAYVVSITSNTTSS